MRDDRILELISAYVDGELTADERALVERELADSPAHRQYLDQLQRQRAFLQGVSKRMLGAAFSARVVGAIEAARPSSVTPDTVLTADSISELISAYVDGEVDAEERGLIERQLAQSAELRRYLAQLQSQRTLLQGIPHRKLSARFPERVLASIEAARPSAQPVQVLAPRKRSRLRATLGLSASVIAAGLALFLFFRFGGPSETKVVEKPPTTVGPSTGTPPVVPVEEDMALAVREFQKLVTYVFVYDIYVTAKGRENKCVDRWLAAAQIPVAKTVKVDDRTEKAIFKAPFLKDRVRVKLPGKVDNEQVEMMLVRGTGRHIDSVQRAYVNDRSLELGEAELLMDLLVAPKDLAEVLIRLNAAAGTNVAQMKADPSVLTIPQAIPIHLTSTLETASFRKPSANRKASASSLASMLADSDALAQVSPKSDPIALTQINALPAGVAPAKGATQGKSMEEMSNEPAQCLFIIRTLK